jgi:hypothetical protein
MKANRYVVAIMVIIILSPIAFSAASRLLTTGPQPFLEPPNAQYENCIRDTEYMRFHHMDYLKEVREEYVRYGIRDSEGLTSCKECHASRERFCNRCHDTVDLYVDCFDCHYYPETAPATSN